MSKTGDKWESVYIERVICCQRVVTMALELPGRRKVRGPECGNTSAERYFKAGDHTEGRFMCEDCPRTKVGKTVVFPESCGRPEARKVA